ncbi:MAG: hypothetical protein VKI39_04185 [Synechococcus sp.]|nr:hypothetical protein [Synechococcus sp.]
MLHLPGVLTSLAICCCGAVAARTVVSPAHAAPAAAIYCTSPGVPAGCVGRPAVRAITPGVGAPGAGVAPGVGAPGAGVRPAAGPGAGPNMGGPVNRGGMR